MKIKNLIVAVLMTLLLVSSAIAWNPILPPIIPNLPAQWETLEDQSIPFNSPDNTVVYSDIFSKCDDPDDAEHITITSTHYAYNLVISGLDIVIQNLQPNYVGTDTVQLACNGVPATFRLTIYDNNLAPVAMAGPDMTVAEDTPVTFDGSASYDPDGTIVSYVWNFGDGYSDTGSHVTHTFTQPGTYLVTLTVMDNLGATGQDTLNVIVDGVPTAVAGGPYSGVENQPILFDASQSTDDQQIVLYRWDWGDGWLTDTTNAYAYHTYAQVGDYTVTLTVIDNLNLQDSDITFAHVVEQGVVPDPDPDPEPKEETTSKSERIIFNKIRHTDYVPAGDYDVRIVSSNDDFKRIEHRVITVI